MGRYTAVDVERNYQEYKKKKNEKKIPDRDYGKTVADYAIEIAMNGGMSKDLNKRYTAVDVEKNYQEYEKKKNEKIIPDRDYGKTAADYAIEMFRNKNAMYNSTGTKEESQQRFLDDHMLKGGLLNPYSAASRAHEDMRSTPEFPTWQPMVERMSDGQVEYARNLLKNQLMDTDRSDFEAYTQSAKETGDKLALYQNELKKREYAKAAAEAQANIERYQKKQNDALSVLPDEQLAVMDEYIDAKKALSAGLTANSLTTSPYTGGNIGAMTTSLWDVNKQFRDAREELESYGIEDLDKLVQYRTEIRDAQRTMQMNGEVQKIVNAPGAKGVAGSALLTAADVLMSPVTGITAAGESLVRKYGYADKESPVNTNSELYLLQNFSNATESAINEKIDLPIGKKAYGIGTSMAKSVYSMAIGGQVTKALGLTGKAATTVGNMVTLPQFGASAYASTLQQDQMRGISTEDATKHAVAAGIGEMVFEVVSLDYVWNVARKSGSKAAKQVIMDSLVGAGIEGSEEGFTSIANEVADRIINGDMSEYGQNIQNYIMQGYSVAEAQKMAEKDFYTEVAGDVLAGAISGGIMTGGANAVSYYHYRKMGNHAVADEQLKNEVVDAAKQMQDDTAAKKLVSTKHTEEITGKDMAVILSSMEESAQQEQLVHAEARFRELGENEAQAKADAREVIKAVSQASEDTGIIENAVRTKKFEKNENLQTVYAELLQEDHSKAPAAVVGNVRKSMEAEEFYQAAVSNRQKGVAKAKNSASGRNVVVTKLANIAPKKEAMVELSDGTRMKLSDVEFGDQTTQNLYDFAATMYDSYAANAVVNNYKGEVLHLYENAVAVFYNAGRLGTSSFESMLGNQKNARLVTAVSSPAILHEMYILGQNSEKNAAKEVAVAPVQPKKNAQAKDTKSKNVKPRTTGTVTDNRTDNMDSRMRKIAEQVAKKTGIDITLNDSLAHGEKGNFQKALVRINLSSESNNEYETLVHELNEFAASYNPVGMKKVIDAVLDYAQTQEGAEYLTKRVQQYQNAYARVETDKTYRDASEEFVFDYLAGVFSSEEGIKDFTRYMTEENMSAKEQKGIMETIADFFKKLFDRITSYLNDHVLSDTAKKGLQADAQRTKEIREMVLDAWNEAVYINKQENSELLKDVNNAMDAGTKFSLSIDAVTVPYSKEQIEDWEGSKKIIVYQNENQYRNFVRDAWEGKLQGKKLYFGKVLDDIAETILKGRGVNVYGYNVALYADNIRKVRKDHGNEERERLRGQRAVVPKDFEHILEVLLHPDKIIDAGIYGKQPAFKIVKDDITVVAVASEGVLDIYPQTMYISKKNRNPTPAADERASVNTPEATRKTVPIDSITQNSEKSTKKYSIDVDEHILQKAQQFKKEGYKNFERVKVLDVTEKINDEVKRLMNFDATGYKIFTNTDTYKHIEKRHGENGTQDYSMKDLRDVALMTYVLKNFDTAELVLDKDGKPDTTYAYSDIHGNPSKMIKFSKKIDGIQHVVVATPENRYKKLWVMSEYKEIKKEDTSQPSYGNNTLPPTSKTHSDNVSSTNIIPYNTEKSTKKYSIEVDEDGIENYIISEETKSLPYSERKKKLLNIMKNEYAGRTAKFEKNGKVYYAFYDERGIRKGIYGDKKSSKQGYRAKINIGADGNYIELAENTLYHSSKSEIGKSNRFHKNAQMWDYYVKTIRSDGKYYDVLINVKNTGEDQYVYDITLKETASLPNPRRLENGSSTVSTDSITQNSEKSTKKYSIDVDKALFSAIEETYSSQEQEMASIIEDGFKALRNVKIDEIGMRKLAYEIKKENQSRYDLETLRENLTRVFAYLKENPNTEFADMVRIVREVARPVIEESTEIDAGQKQMYDDFRNYLKGQKIRLNEEQKAEVAHYYGSYDNFRKLNFGNVTFSDNGTYLDRLWNEICANSYQMLDIEISTADEPIALIDALNALKPTRRNIFGMNKDQASYDLALDIFQKFFRQQAAESANAKVREKTARLNERQREYRKRVKAEYDASLQRLREVEKEKRQKTIDRYEEKIHTLKENQRQAMEYKDVKYANRMKEQIERTKGLLAIAKIEENGKITRLKVQNRENMLNKRRNEEMRKYRERIKKNANGIIAYFNSNTDKKHVPEMLKDTVARFITSIDYMGEHAYTDSAATIRWQEALSQLYMQLSNQNLAIAEGYEEIYNALTGWGEKDETVGGVLEDIQGFLGANANLKISEMGLTQLQELDEMITALKRVITTVNKLYVNKRMEHVSELGESTLAELGEKRDKKAHNELIEKTDTLLNVSMMDARSFFYRLGDTSLSIYEEWRTGFNERVWMLKEAQDYMQGLLKDIDVKSWTGEKAKVHTFMVEGKELQMTTGQIMTLYVLKKRYLAKQHMNNGGIRPEKIGKGKKAIDRVKAIPLTDFDLDKISDKLTTEQKQVADAMQQFIENTCAGWGNKASMMLYGYKRFGAKNYFPMKTDGNSVDTKDETDLFAAKKQSFTKETNEHAKNALIIGDIFDVFTNHVSGMATYSAFTAPLMDSMRWFNYRNDQHDSVKTEIERVYGKNYKDYFTQLIRDINGEARNGIDMRIMDDLISKMKAASVGANLRVAIQQPTAYIRAAAVMNPKYLSKAMAAGPKKIKSQMKRAKENSAITLWKSWGYFETSIGRSMKSVITGQDTLRNKVVEKSMIMAQVGDDITWGYLWNACEEEIKDKHPDIAYDSKEFLKLTSERFDEVVDQTQVVDSVLHRSQIMRKTDIGAKMATSFMAEPTKSFNLLMNAVRDIQENGGKSARKRFGRVLAAYVITNTVNAAVVSVADTARNPDEDKDFWERYMEQLKENLVDNLNPLGMIPFAKDILSMTQGFDVARMDMQGLANLLKGWDMVVRYVTDEEYRQTHTAYEALKAITRGVSQVIGVPAYNLLREVETMYNVLTGKYLGGKKYSNTENYGKLMDAKIGGKEEDYDEIEGELRERDKGYFDISSGKRGAAKDELLDAILEGDAERYNEISEELKKNEVNVEGMSDTEENALKQFFLEGKITEEDALEKGISKETIKDWKEEYQEKEEFKRIENEYSFGDITRKQAEKRLQDLGKDENEVWHQMREWDYKIAHPDEEYTGDYKIMHDTIDAAIISERKKGRYDDASRDKIQKEIKALLAHGKEKKDIGASITRRYKEVYLEAKKSGTYATLKNMLISAYMAAGYTRDDAMTKIESWEKE